MRPVCGVCVCVMLSQNTPRSQSSSQDKTKEQNKVVMWHGGVQLWGGRLVHTIPLAAEPASLDYMKPYLQKEFLRSFPRSLSEIMQYNPYSTRFTVMPNLGCPLGMPGKRKLQLRNFLQQLACGHASGAFSGLLIDRGGPSPRWAVAPLGCLEKVT